MRAREVEFGDSGEAGTFAPWTHATRTSEGVPDRGWMQTLSLLNPVEWATRAARGEALPGADWGEMGTFLLLLAAFVVATGAFATWCFRSYQRAL